MPPTADFIFRPISNRRFDSKCQQLIDIRTFQKRNTGEQMVKSETPNTGDTGLSHKFLYIPLNLPHIITAYKLHFDKYQIANSSNMKRVKYGLVELLGLYDIGKIFDIDISCYKFDINIFFDI